MRVPCPGAVSISSRPPRPSARSRIIWRPKWSPFGESWRSHPTPSSSIATRSQAPSRCDADSGAIGRRVLAHVHERLLDDAHGLDLRRGRDRAERTVGGLEIDGDPVLRAELVQVLGEGGNEPEPARHEGAEAEDRLAHLLVGAPGDAHHLAQVLGDGRRVGRAGECGLQLHVEQTQLLGEAVVHLAGEALALLHGGQAPDLLREPRPLDGDRRLRGEAGEQLGLVRGELPLVARADVDLADGVVPQAERGDEVRARVLGTDDRSDHVARSENLGGQGPALECLAARLERLGGAARRPRHDVPARGSEEAQDHGVAAQQLPRPVHHRLEDAVELLEARDLHADAVERLGLPHLLLERSVRAPQLAIVLLQPFGHDVEGLGEHPDLVRRADPHAGLEAAVGEALGGVREPSQRHGDDLVGADSGGDDERLRPRR